MTLVGAAASPVIFAAEGDFEEDGLSGASSAVSTPEIEAKVYSVKVVRPSRSGRVYLIQKDDPGNLPEPGRIFLLKDSFNPVMGFRTLKNYPSRNQIAAKKVRVYPNYDALVRDSRYRSYEKTGEISVVPPQTAQDLEDLSDLESSGDLSLEQTPPPPEAAPETVAPLEEPPAPLESPSEPALESTSSMDLEPSNPPPPLEEAPASTPVPTTAVTDPGEQNVEINDEDEEDEESQRDHFPHWLTVDFGGFRKLITQPQVIPGPGFQRGAGIRYAKNVAYGLFSSKAFQSDSLSLEGGFFYYKAAGDVNGRSKSYTLMPLIATGRYNLPLNDRWSFYVYGGLYYHLVIGNVGATDAELAQIGVVAPAGGIGFIVQTGPNWYLRLNLGMESIAGGVVLRF